MMSKKQHIMPLNNEEIFEYMTYLYVKNKILQKENEQLKEEIRAYPINEQYAEEIMQQNQKLRIERNDFRIENKKLRKTINEVIELLTEEVDLFSDKATEHDIIAYKEMNKFDNKDAYYMCISTKKAIKMLQRCLDE